MVKIKPPKKSVRKKAGRPALSSDQVRLHTTIPRKAAPLLSKLSEEKGQPLNRIILDALRAKYPRLKF